MKNIFLHLSFLILFVGFYNNTFAQIEFSNQVKDKLEKIGLEFFEPLENQYHSIKVKKNKIVNSDFIIKSKKAEMEIRFLIKEDNEKTQFPHINVMSMASTAATNDEDARMVLHQMSEKDLLEYNADWGATVFFQPKEWFCEKEHCKMIAIYKEGNGLAYMFYLFDNATKEVDNQKYCMRFK